MGLFTYDIKTFDDLYMHQLQDIYYAENQIAKALPKMVSKATDPTLRAAFEQHRQETEEQILRLQEVFRAHGREPSGVDCPAIDGIIQEADETSSEVEDKEVLDAALIAAAQAVEHYEITRYGTLVAWAERLGRTEDARHFREILEEEKATDMKLTQLAESTINRRAA